MGGTDRVGARGAGTSARARTLPLGVLGVVVLVALAEGFTARHELDLAGTDAVQWSAAARAARGLGDRVDVLCVGTSANTVGFLPRVFDRVTGLRSFNLAIGCGPPAAQLAMFRRALASGSRPKALLVDLHPASLSGHAGLIPRLWAEVLGPGEALRLAVADRDALLFARVLALQAVPSVRHRDRIRRAVVTALTGLPDGSPKFNRAIRRNLRVNAGAFVQAVRPYGGEVNDFDRVCLANWPWQPTREAVGSIHRLFDLAESRGVRVFWLIPPLAPGMRAQRAGQGLDRAYEAFARGLLERHRNVSVIDGLDAGYGNELFGDPVHLNRRGAAAYTEAVGAAVAAALADPRAPRWAALRAYRAGDDAVAEDLGESLAAVLAGGGSVRR